MGDAMIRWQNRPRQEWFDAEMKSLFEPIMGSIPDPREHPESGKTLPHIVRPQYFYHDDAGRIVLRIDRKLLMFQIFGRGEVFYPLGSMVIAMEWAYEANYGVKIKSTEEEPDTLIAPQWFVDMLKTLDYPRCLGFKDIDMLILGKRVMVSNTPEDFYLVKGNY